MDSNNDFAGFLVRIRAGDPTAAEEMIRKFEPAIRVIVRTHLSGPLRRHFDSMDICQSVMGTFFARAALGQYDLNDGKELLSLLARMTRNKLASQARYHQRDCRDARRAVGGEGLDLVVGDAVAPDRIAAGRDLLQRVREQLQSDERDIADRRADGQDWEAIALAMGGTAEGRRKQLARAIDRMSAQFGLIEDADE